VAQLRLLGAFAFSDRSLQAMRKSLVILAKLIFATLSTAGVGLLIFEGCLIWHYEYGLGLPSEDQLAAAASAGPACTSHPGRTYIPLAEMPPLLRNAAIAYEQPDFYEVWSLNPFIELVLSVTRGEHPQSGITQSVAQCFMSSLAPACCRGLDWSIGTLVVMSRMTSALSRDRIFEIYLNENYLGRDSYGVGAASMSYFGKPLGSLRNDEIALIAALQRTPFDRRADLALGRRDFVIERMRQAGLINDTEAASARERPVEFRVQPVAAPSEPRL
jgi:membrane peptidoglycan carboxypeptidase